MALGVDVSESVTKYWQGVMQGEAIKEECRERGGGWWGCYYTTSGSMASAKKGAQSIHLSVHPRTSIEAFDWSHPLKLFRALSNISPKLPLTRRGNSGVHPSNVKLRISLQMSAKKYSKGDGKNTCSLLHISVIHPIWMGQDGCHMGHSHIGTFSKYMFPTTSTHTAAKKFMCMFKKSW